MLTKFYFHQTSVIKRTMTCLNCALLTLMIGACTTTNPPKMSEAHLKPVKTVNKDIPAFSRLPVLPAPVAAPKLETYTVVVNEVPVKELLFSVARDAKINVDIHSGIEGIVTLNAVDQTLPQILDRISRQVDLRYQLEGPNLVVSPDLAYWRLYHVDYVNMSRDSTSEVNVATQIATTGGSVAGGGSAGDAGNKSNTNVKNISNNHFWSLLIGNIQSILQNEKQAADKKERQVKQEQAVQSQAAGAAAPGLAGVVASTIASAVSATPTETTTEATGAGESEQMSPVVANPVSGVINVYATQRQHQQVQSFIDKVMVNAQRQVLIEMTIVEVELSDSYQAGVDWSRLARAGGGGPSLSQQMLGTNLANAPVLSLGYANATSAAGNIAATLKLLEAFGNVKVLSSPKIMALNNQTALLKVVDETVYFTVTQETSQADGTIDRTITSEVHTVPVGLVMSVMPQINDNNQVTLNIRPTISRITSFKEDPLPNILKSDFQNLIPQIQVREMESLLQVNDGQTIVMGGLMQNKFQKDRNGVPGLSDLPYVGDVFSYRNEKVTKTELVLFLKPTVIKNGGLNLDMEPYNRYLESDSGPISDAGKIDNADRENIAEPNNNANNAPNHNNSSRNTIDVNKISLNKQSEHLIVEESNPQ